MLIISSEYDKFRVNFGTTTTTRTTKPTKTSAKSNKTAKETLPPAIQIKCVAEVTVEYKQAFSVLE